MNVLIISVSCDFRPWSRAPSPYRQHRALERDGRQWIGTHLVERVKLIVGCQAVRAARNTCGYLAVVPGAAGGFDKSCGQLSRWRG
ncbi:MAG: hypothetical protein JHD00_03560 [Akkermansiaceae bacterium]|nr:hypothetical protein [Akkermansiaceae bacterium]